MRDVNEVFSGISVQHARADAKERGVTIGHLTSYVTQGCRHKWVEIYEDGVQVQTGYYYNVAEAKSNYILHKGL